MLCLIPAVKSLTLQEGCLSQKRLHPVAFPTDARLEKALEKLPCGLDGVPFSVYLTGRSGEGYVLDIEPQAVTVIAQSPAGAFYGIQTLRQLFREETVPCLHIEDQPDFAYRGFYHDVTRGKLPTLQTLKFLVDQMAYYKLNSLQLYIEHTFDLKEYKGVHPATGYYTAEEMQALDAYCRENFIDLVPSLSTFGHLYELLNQEQYRHLAVSKDYVNPNVWYARMRHHTIDPLHPESIGVIDSMIRQTAPAFSSPWFNICCDETFDLQTYEKQGKDPGQLYVDFVKKIADRTKQAGKQVMMWADILLKHPETIDQLPDDICFLNWEYISEPSEEKIARLAKTGKPQIVCPGTTTWNRFCENVDVEEKNICRMAEYGHKHGAVGLLNTNWGDWGNPCSLELSMYGLVLGAEKAWSVATQVTPAFYRQVDRLLYEQDGVMDYLIRLSRLHDQVSYLRTIRNYYSLRYAHTYGADKPVTLWEAVTAPVEEIQADCRALIDDLSAERWVRDDYRQEMLVAAEGICLMAELNAKLIKAPCVRITDTKAWLEKFRTLWLAKNDPNELWRIEGVLLDLDVM